MKKTKIAILVIILLFGFINISFAENLSELQAKKDEIKENLSNTNKELENLKIELTDNLEAINRLNLQIQNEELELAPFFRVPPQSVKFPLRSH